MPAGQKHGESCLRAYVRIMVSKVLPRSEGFPSLDRDL